MDKEKKVEIHNVKEYAFEHDIVVYRKDDDGQNWFWGAFDDLLEAGQAAGEIQGYCAPICAVVAV